MRRLNEKMNQMLIAGYVRGIRVKERVFETLKQNTAEGFVDTALKILISVVVGALLLAGLYTLFKDTILPTLQSKIQNLLTTTANSKIGVISLKVTARISKGFERAGHLKAYATLCLADSFLVTGVRVVECENGLRVFMPSTKDPDGEYHDVCFPITPDCRTRIETAVLNAYDSFIKETEGDE